mgnify:CR=1 FL=1
MPSIVLSWSSYSGLSIRFWRQRTVLGLLPQNTVLLLDIDILLLDHQLQLHFVLEPADRILYYLPYNLRLIRLLHITHDPVLVTPFLQYGVQAAYQEDQGVCPVPWKEHHETVSGI